MTLWLWTECMICVIISWNHVFLTSPNGCFTNYNLQTFTFSYLIDEFEEISVSMHTNCRDYEFKTGECFFFYDGAANKFKAQWNSPLTSLSSSECVCPANVGGKTARRDANLNNDFIAIINWKKRIVFWQHRKNSIIPQNSFILPSNSVGGPTLDKAITQIICAMYRAAYNKEAYQQNMMTT